MILVAGATGLVGMETCRLLATTGHKVRAMVRATSAREKVAALQKLGVELVTADVREPATLRAACRGATVVISTATSTTHTRRPGETISNVDHDGQLRLVEAAEKAGVHRFCFLSFRHRPEIANPLDEAKRAVERRLNESPIEHCILQASVFMEVWLSPAMGFDAAQRRARVLGSGDQPISYVSYRDVAQVCAAVAVSPAYRVIVPVGGPYPQTPNEVVQIFESVTGAKFTVERVPVEAIRRQLESAPDEISKTFAGLALWYTMGDPIDMKWLHEQFPQIRLTSVREYVERLAHGATAHA